MTGAPGWFSVVACATCGLRFTYPRLQAEDFETYYPRSYTAYRPRSQGRRLPSPGALLDRIRLGAIVRHGPYRRIWRLEPGRLLDVGCGTGELGAVFSAKGWTVAGVEPSEAACTYARERGIDVHNGTLDDAPWGSETFDAVIFNHSLEHIERPADALAAAAQLLRRGGMLIVSVPNFRSWQRRVFGSRWFQLDLPRHLQHFERSSLGALVQRVGLKPVAVSVSSMRPSLLLSLQYAFFGRQRIGGRPFQLATWVFLPVVALTDVVSEGDCLHLVATR